MKVTVSQLLEILIKVNDEVGGDCEVKLFSGLENTYPPSTEEYCETYVITDVMVSDTKSFMDTKPRYNNDDNVKVWLKFVDESQ